MLLNLTSLFRPKVLIYGINEQAQQLFRFLNEDRVANVCGFVVDKGYKRQEYLLGKKVYEFEEMLEKYSPEKYQIVLSFGYKNMVKNRKDKFEKCKLHGYKLFTYVSKQAVVYADEIGEGSVIYPCVFLGAQVRVGKGCFFENGVSISHNSQVSDFVFCGPNAVVCGDTFISDNCFIGANAVVTNSLKIAERTLISAGAKISKDTEAGMLCFPARSFRTTETEPEKFI